MSAIIIINFSLSLSLVPWLVAFSQNNYTIIENAVYTIPVHSMNPIDTPLSLTVQTCPGTQPLGELSMHISTSCLSINSTLMRLFIICHTIIIQLNDYWKRSLIK